MFYLLHGTDTEKARAKAHGLLDVLNKKRPDAELFKINSENWNAAEFEGYIGGQGLFENKYIVFCDHLCDEEAAVEMILQKLKEIKESKNAFVFLEGDLDKKTVMKFEKYVEKKQSFDLPRATSRGSAEFKIFALSDALGARDKKSLWVLYQKAKRSGLEDEQIHGTLFWMVKSMILAAESKSATEAGLNPFVYSKAVRYAINYEGGELPKISSNLVSLYHESRRGGPELAIALEKFIL